MIVDEQELSGARGAFQSIVGRSYCMFQTFPVIQLWKVRMAGTANEDWMQRKLGGRTYGRIHVAFSGKVVERCCRGEVR